MGLTLKNMDMITLDRVRAVGNLSGYIYLHIPSRIARQFHIRPNTYFEILFYDGKLILKQEDPIAAQLGAVKTETR